MCTEAPSLQLRLMLSCTNLDALLVLHPSKAPYGWCGYTAESEQCQVDGFPAG